MDARENTASSGRGRPSKVVRLLEEYGLSELGAELEERWTADEDRDSLRELAAYFNQQLLERSLEEAGVEMFDGETENLYRLLTSDDVNPAERTRVRRRLERDGIDIDVLESDFVTYQAIRTYLQKYRDADYNADKTDPLDRERVNFQKLRGRTAAVTENKLEQLRGSGHVTLDEFRTLVNIQVVCEGCNTQMGVQELLEDGGCECTED
jgi:hypothetical protein